MIWTVGGGDGWSQMSAGGGVAPSRQTSYQTMSSRAVVMPPRFQPLGISRITRVALIRSLWAIGGGTNFSVASSYAPLESQPAPPSDCVVIVVASVPPLTISALLER